MLTVVVEQTIRCAPKDLVDLVMDIESYARVDDKIHPVRWVRRTPARTEFACRPKIAGLPSPVIVQHVDRTSDTRIDIAMAPLPQNRIGHKMATFSASFECFPDAGATRVVRTLNFDFPPLLAWLAEPLLRRRLRRDVETELRRAKDHLESRVDG